MVDIGTWTILGQDELARQLAHAASYIEAPQSTTIVTDGQDVPVEAVATGRAVLHEGTSTVIPHLLGFRAFEQAAQQIRSGQIGKAYACFGSCRLPRDATPDEVREEALLPLLAYTTTLFTSDIQRIWARNASLFQDGDAWFVTIRLEDDTLITLEALPAVVGAAAPELLVEVTGSERVVRAEPTRQAVTVESLDRPGQRHAWWEDPAERLLLIIRSGEYLSDTGNELREAWAGIQHSSETGRPAAV